MAEIWEPIASDEVLHPGDMIRLHYKIVGMGKVPTALQLEAVGNAIEKKDPRFQVVAYSYPDAGAGFYKVRIQEPKTELQRASLGSCVVALLAGALSAALLSQAIYHASGGAERRTITEGIADTVKDTAFATVPWLALAIIGYIAIKRAGRK